MRSSLSRAELANQALRRGQFKEAEALFLEAFESDPQCLDHLFGVSQALSSRGAWREAIEFLMILVSEAEHTAQAWEKIADCAYSLHDHEQWIFAHQSSLAAGSPTVKQLVTFSRRLMSIHQSGEAMRLLSQAKRLEPDAIEVHLALADLYHKLGNQELTLQALSAVVALDPEHAQAHAKVRQLLNQRVPTWHFPMMNDAPRNRAFEEAIIARLSPDDTVLDIGCGAGLLSLMAARAGAKQVLAIEGEEAVADAAEAIFEANGYSEQIHLVRGRSTLKEVGRDLPTRADLLVSEIFDVSLLGEDALYTLKHARERLLKPGAKVIPAQARVWCALVESDELRARFHVDYSCGFDLSSFNQLRDPRVLQLDLGRFNYALLTEPTLAMNFDFEGEIRLSGEQIMNAPVIKSGRPDGFIFWYDLVLAPATSERDELVLSTSPDQEGTHWLQGFAPCYEPHSQLIEGTFAQFLCAYRRFLLWFKLY